jgi:hypothetical protein
MFVISFVVGLIFMSVYGVAANAILHCFIVQHEIAKHKGGVSKEFVPSALTHLIEHSHKKKPQE